MMKLVNHLIKLCLGILTTIFSGYVLAKMWGWFIVPAFEVNALSTYSAIGVMFVISFMLMPVFFIGLREKFEKDGMSAEAAGWAENATKVISIGLSLLSAYVWHFFI